jgi:hypothetical protein
MLQRIFSSFWFRLLLVIVLLLPCLTLRARGAPLRDPESDTGSISGALTDLRTGEPAGGWVVLCRFGDPACKDPRYAKADHAGLYSFRTLPAGTYKICFHPLKHGWECYDDWPHEGRGTPIEVAEGQAVADIDAQLRPLGKIRGRVIDGTTGQGLAQVGISAETVLYNGVAIVAQTASDATGRYELEGLSPASYRLRFDGSGIGYADKYYRDGAARDDATLVSIGTDQIIEGVEMRLLPRGRIAGRVNALGTTSPLEGIEVTVDGPVWPRGTAVTNCLGFYEIGGLQLVSGGAGARWGDDGGDRRRAASDGRRVGPGGRPGDAGAGSRDSGGDFPAER